MRGISLVAEKLLFSLQEICCMELVSLCLKKNCVKMLGLHNFVNEFEIEGLIFGMIV
jgi:hypothetical protein